jgi:hypothetical protein
MMRLYAGFVIGLVFLAAMMPLAALAEEVNVRGGAHSGYSRIVFDWSESVDYSAEKVGDTRLTVQFSENATFNINNNALERLANIKSVTTSADGATVQIETFQSFDLRDFRIGDRVIVDILNPPDLDERARRQEQAREQDKQKDKKQDKQDQQDTKDQKRASEKENNKQAVQQQKAAKKSDQENAQKTDNSETGTLSRISGDTDQQAPEKQDKAGETEKSSPETRSEQQAQKARESGGKTQSRPDEAAFNDANVITVSATQPVDLAAFERAGHLWIVVGRADVRVPPQISGPQSDAFGDFQKLALDEATAFYVKMPRHAEHLYGEGGGLVWRVVMTPNNRPNIKPIPPNRIVDKSKARGDKIRWPLQRTGRVIELEDPLVGDTLKVVTVRESDNFTGPKREFVDFTALRAPVGMAVRPKVDDLQVKNNKPNGIVITRKDGLALTPESELAGSEIAKAQDEGKSGDQDTVKRIFDFSQWALVGPDELRQNESSLMNGLANSNEDALAADLLSLAKLFVSNGWGEEALGYLDYTAGIMPEIRSGTEFRALRGVANALSGKYKKAFRNFSDDSYEGSDEIDLWRAYTLAHLEDWRQAFDVLPENLDILKEYPRDLRINAGLTAAEIALRGGETKRGASLLDLVRRDKPHMIDSDKAALQYLEGQVARQRDEFDKAEKLLKPLANALDDLYRTKAGLALTNLKLKRDEIGLDEAINRLERIRYGWRGDDLEVNVNYRLGQMYIRNGNYMKGLTTLRRAASLSSSGSDLGEDITNYMRNIFQQIFLGKRAERIEPLKAVSLYEEFSELTPPGKRGDKLIRALAERLVQVDLLGRAADLLSNQVKSRLEGRKAVEVGLRLAGIRLLNNNAEQALKDLERVQRMLNNVPIEQRTPLEREHQLLKARALSQSGRPDNALDLLNRLEQNEKTMRLRANIAWNAGRWPDAAGALADLIKTMDIEKGEPLTDKQAEILLNRAVALNLANSRYKLENMRKRFGKRMQETKRGRLFEVVTRPRNTGALANRQTLQSIVSEVDMFEEFLNAYRTTGDNAG